MNFREKGEDIAKIIHYKRLSELSLEQRRRINTIARQLEDTPTKNREIEEVSRRFLLKYHMDRYAYKEGKQIATSDFFIPGEVKNAYYTLISKGYKPTKKIHKKEIIQFLTIDIYRRADHQLFYHLDEDDYKAYLKVGYEIVPNLEEWIFYPWNHDEKFMYVLTNTNCVFEYIDPSLQFLFIPREIPAEQIKEQWKVREGRKEKPTLPLLFSEAQIDFFRFSLAFDLLSIRWLYMNGYSEVKDWSYLASIVSSLLDVMKVAVMMEEDMNYPDAKLSAKVSLRKIAEKWTIPKTTFIRRLDEVAMMKKKGYLFDEYCIENPFSSFF